MKRYGSRAKGPLSRLPRGGGAKTWPFRLPQAIPQTGMFNGESQSLRHLLDRVRVEMLVASREPQEAVSDCGSPYALRISSASWRYRNSIRSL